MKLVSVAEMVAIEKEADANGLSYAVMMENAGLGLADAVDKRYGQKPQRKVVALVGSGNNGGDALVALRVLAERGWETSAFVIKKRKGEKVLEKALMNAGGKIFKLENGNLRGLRSATKKADVLLDGILGTGIKMPLKDDISVVLKRIKKIDTFPKVVAIDCPSGVDCDTGEAANDTLKADLTVCMGAIKKGLLKFPAYELSGELIVVDIGIPGKNKAAANIKNFVVDVESLKRIMPARPLNAHKGSFGKVMIVGGSINYCGAVLLAGRADCAGRRAL